MSAQRMHIQNATARVTAQQAGVGRADVDMRVGNDGDERRRQEAFRILRDADDG